MADEEIDWLSTPFVFIGLDTIDGKEHQAWLPIIGGAISVDGRWNGVLRESISYYRKIVPNPYPGAVYMIDRHVENGKVRPSTARFAGGWHDDDMRAKWKLELDAYRSREVILKAEAKDKASDYLGEMTLREAKAILKKRIGSSRSAHLSALIDYLTR